MIINHIICVHHDIRYRYNQETTMSRLKTKFNFSLFSHILIVIFSITSINTHAAAQQHIPVQNKVDNSTLLPEETAIIKSIYGASFESAEIIRVKESDLVPTIDGYMYLSREKSGETPYLKHLQDIASIIINEKNQVISLIYYNPEKKAPKPVSGLKHLKVLSFESGLTHVPHLTNLPELEVLDISRSMIPKLANINDLPKLRVLDLFGSDNMSKIIPDTNLQPIPSLEVLILPISKIRKLDLSLFPNLRKLLINANKLTEIEFAHTPYLEELNLERCGIKTFDKFKGITNLKHMRKLAISGRPFGYFPVENIPHFTNITELQASVDTQADINAINGFKNLRKLELFFDYHNLPIKNLGFLSDKKDLEELTVSAIIHTTKGLHSLKKLRKLWLQSDINKFEDMHDLDSLEEIQFTGGSIKDMSGLSAVTTPRKIFCDDSWSCRIQKLGGLENMKNLEILSLPKAGITKIQGLDKGLKKLRELNLNNNRISRLEGLDNLTNLEKLTLKNNKITKMEGMDNLKSLVWLGLSGNPIKKMEGLDKLANLERLFLENTDIEVLENYQNLTSLYGHLWNTKILDNPANRKAINEVNKMGLSKQAMAAGKRQRARDKRYDKEYDARHIKAELAEAKQLKEEYIDWVKRGKKYQTKK